MFNSKSFFSFFIYVFVFSYSSLSQSAEINMPNSSNVASKYCAQCHPLGKGEAFGVGPNLFGIIGRKAGSVQGFPYSKAFISSMSGKTWDANLLNQWLMDPQKLAPGSEMVMYVDDAKSRKKLIESLSSLR